MAIVRKAHTIWSGDLKSGNGNTTFDSSGIGTYPVTWKARSEEPEATTSPEELIAAAHSACFSMAFSNELSKQGFNPTELNTEAVVDFVVGTGITTSQIMVKGKVDGISAEQFQEIAQLAGKNCPVSKALTGIEIKVDASLA